MVITKVFGLITSDGDDNDKASKIFHNKSSINQLLLINVLYEGGLKSSKADREGIMLEI